MKHRVRRFDIRMTADQSKVEHYLNSMEGEVAAVVPSVAWAPRVQVDFLLIVERIA
jgi:hypothetical protein